MATWTSEAARDIYRLLDEVDHHIVKARERIRGRNFEKARNHLMAAISVKLTAVRGFPAADSASQPQISTCSTMFTSHSSPAIFVVVS